MSLRRANALAIFRQGVTLFIIFSHDAPQVGICEMRAVRRRLVNQPRHVGPALFAQFQANGFRLVAQYETEKLA